MLFKLSKNVMSGVVAVSSLQ